VSLSETELMRLAYFEAMHIDGLLTDGVDKSGYLLTGSVELILGKWCLTPIGRADMMSMRSVDDIASNIHSR